MGTHRSRMNTVGPTFKRLHTGVGRFRSYLHKCGMAPSAACEFYAQKNKPSTTLFSNVQYIDLSMDCTSSQFAQM